MDLLCTESIVTHSEQSLHRYKKKTPTEQQITNNFNINCNCITCSSVCFSTIAKCNTATDATTDSIPAVSVRVPSACNMSKLVYVISSVATPTSPTLSTKQLKQTQLNNDQLLYQLPSHHQSNNSKLTAITNETEAVGDKRFVYENAHVIVTDPIFKSDRCLENALKSEVKAQILGTYLKTVQKDITPPMRKIVAEWMMEVCAEEKCQEEVVLLAINYMDRFLSTKSVRKTHLQILAAACLLVASKIREPTCRALSAELLVFYTDNSIYKDDLIKWELYVLSRLGWDISSVTPLDFLELWIIRLPMKCKDFSDLNTEKVRHLAQTFICLAAKEYKFSKYTASTIAASSIVAAMNRLKCHLCTGDNIQIFFSFFTDLTSVGQEQLHQCTIQMEVLYNDQSHTIQPYFLGIDKQQPFNAYYKSPYLQSDQHHQKRLMSVLPKFAQTCKLQAHAQKDLHEIKL